MIRHLIWQNCSEFFRFSDFFDCKVFSLDFLQTFSFGFGSESLEFGIKCIRWTAALKSQHNTTDMLVTTIDRIYFNKSSHCCSARLKDFVNEDLMRNGWMAGWLTEFVGSAFIVSIHLSLCVSCCLCSEHSRCRMYASIPFGMFVHMCVCWVRCFRQLLNVFVWTFECMNASCVYVPYVLVQQHHLLVGEMMTFDRIVYTQIQLFTLKLLDVVPNKVCVEWNQDY